MHTKTEDCAKRFQTEAQRQDALDIRNAYLWSILSSLPRQRVGFPFYSVQQGMTLGAEGVLVFTCKAIAVTGRGGPYVFPERYEHHLHIKK
jgi:hypothetical protein